MNTVIVRNMYSKIQTKLFYMIPEKWDKIYLYASIVDRIGDIQTGEMFFYYYPKGVLKKNPVNCYEVPMKFNIDENAYMKLVEQLYEEIKKLREEFRRKEEKLWSNITISIKNLKFNVEYNYEDLSKSSYTSYDRHIIWKYKYLDFPVERLSKKDREMLEKYLINEKFENTDISNYSEGIYNKDVHNVVEEYINNDDTYKNEQTDNQNSKSLKKDKYEEYKQKVQMQKEKQKEILNKYEIHDENIKNQILGSIK